MKRLSLTALALLCATLAGRQVLAASTSEAFGKVEDAQGNPIPEAVVTLVNAGNAKASYEAKTDKKGRYFASGLMYVPPGYVWNVSVKKTGYVPSRIKVQSSTQSELVATFETDLRPDGSPHAVPIKVLGKATIDFVMVPGEVTSQAAAQDAAAAAAAAANPQDPLSPARQKVAEGDYAGSIDLYAKAMETNGEDPAARLEFSRVLLKLERYKDAEVQAKKAVELSPDKPGANRVLANIYYKNDELEKAEAALAKERKLSPDDPGVLSFAASLAEELGHTDDAIAANEALVAQNPKNGPAWLSLAGLYAKKNQPDKSEAAYRQLTEIDPAAAPQTFYNIGATIMNKPSPTPADTQKAAEAYRKAVSLKPDYAAAQKELGFALLNLGQLDEARAALEKYLELEPKAKDAAQIRDTLKSLPKKK